MTNATTRRTILGAMASTPLAALPAVASTRDDEAYPDDLMVIRKRTGLSLDALDDILSDLPITVTAQIANKSATVPFRMWTSAQTHAAVVVTKSANWFGPQGRDFPLFLFMETAIRNRGDRAQIAKSLSRFKDSGTSFPRLMDMAQGVAT